MKNFKKKLVLAAMVVISVLFIGALPAQAATKGVAYKWTSKNITIYQDVTGNNKKDTIKVQFSNKDANGAYKTLQVHVNGKNALKVQVEQRFYGARVRWFYLSQSKKFLQIACTTDNDILVSNAIYQYNTKTKKLVRVLNLNSGTGTGQYVNGTSSTAISVGHSYQPAETGRIQWNFIYKYENGKFQLQSNIASVKSSLTNYDPGDGYTAYFKKNQYVVANPLKFYTTTSLNKAAFTAKRGDVLTLQKVKVSGKNVYLQFKKGNVSGWRKVGGYPYNVSGSNMASSGWFYGVFNRLAG